MQSVKITITNRDARLALAALNTIVKERGFPDTATATAVGRTIRRLRSIEEEMDDARRILVQAHAKLDEDSKPIESGVAGLILKSPQEFIVELRKLEKETRECEVWPILVSVLGNGEGKKCTRCKQVTGLPSPEEYATLLDVGILLEKTDG